MQKSSTSDFIREKVKELMENRGIKKTKLGEILGSKKTDSSQQNFLRADRFLRGGAEIKVEALVRVARFFEKPVEYFLGNISGIGGLATSEKNKTQPLPPLDQIRNSLEKMGMDSDFIDQEISKLEKMER